jgi:parallel beta-helix repeat protein
VCVALLGLLTLPAEAATLAVDCDAGSTIVATVRALVKAGDTLVVSGTCRENVAIPAEVVGITLDGQKRATIQHPGPVASPGAASHALYIRGRGITITGFTITGGQDGIHLSGPAHAVINGNVITGNLGRGIHLDKGSVAQIVNNAIQGNGGVGIHVTENSHARIGFLIPPDEKPAPNTIQTNGGHGVQVGLASSAWIVGNTIVGNKASGIMVDRNSTVDIVGNTITANDGDAITTSRHSGVNLKSEGTPRHEGPNQTDPARKNGGVGIRCSMGGYVDGPLGTLTGIRGPKDFDKTCIDRLDVR